MQLTLRNLKIYLRDKTAVFFSLLTMLIVIVLMLVFLGDMNVNSIAGVLDEFGAQGSRSNKENAELLLLWWTIAGIISINAVTITLSSITTMINDAAGQRLQSFYTTPVSRLKIAMGYLISAWLSSVIICVLTFVIAEIYAVMQGSEMLSVSVHTGCWHDSYKFIYIFCIDVRSGTCDKKRGCVVKPGNHHRSAGGLFGRNLYPYVRLAGRRSELS